MWDEPDNDERADSVAGFVIEFARSRYHGTEYVETIVQDMITNLGHFLDRTDSYPVLTSRGEECEIDPAYCQPGAGGDFVFGDVLASALTNYLEEHAEEQERETTW